MVLVAIMESYVPDIDSQKIADGLRFEELEIGMQATCDEKVTKIMSAFFEALSHDSNPLHSNSEYAKNTIFGEPIAHGVLILGFISAAIGTVFPGPGWAITGMDKVRFRAPVKFGDTVRTQVIVREKLTHERVRLDIKCFVGDTAVIKGEAVVFDSRNHQN